MQISVDRSAAERDSWLSLERLNISFKWIRLLLKGSLKVLQREYWSEMTNFLFSVQRIIQPIRPLRGSQSLTNKVLLCATCKWVDRNNVFFNKAQTGDFQLSHLWGKPLSRMTLSKNRASGKRVKKSKNLKTKHCRGSSNLPLCKLKL